MKKKLFLATIIIFSLFMTGCSNYENDKGAEEKANNILNNKVGDKTEGENNSSKILIAYFSRTGENYNVGNIDVGNTAMMASYIKEYLKADSFEIVPVKKYPNSYNDCLEVATKEKDNNERPKIQNKVNNFEEYDTIFLGYPIWWGDMPMIIYTFMEEYDFSNKKVIPFNTHEGSGSSSTYERIKSKLNTSNVITDGLALNGKKARSEEGKNETISWLKKLGY